MGFISSLEPELKFFNKKIIMRTILIIAIVFLFIDNNFNKLMSSYLGKIYLIVLLILSTCENKYFGLLFVALIIYLRMNSNDIENFETENKDEKNKKMLKSEDAKINVVTDISDSNEEINNITDKKDTNDTKDIKETNEMVEETIKSDSTKNQAVEGFDLQSTENSLKRGKQSNSIPVEQILENTTNETISPFEQNNFSENFSIL